MEKSVVKYRRDLTRDDLERMRLPSRHWDASFSGISGIVAGKSGVSLLDMVTRYGKQLDDMIRNGYGFILWGANSTGKTSAVCCMAKEFRRRGYTVLFQQASELKRMVFEKEHFDPEETYWDRAINVDVLVLDDLGKGIHDSKGMGAALIDELVRTRSSRKLVTIITSNVSPRRWDATSVNKDPDKRGLDLKLSTMEALKECAIAVQVDGENRREVAVSNLEQMMAFS